MAFPRTISWLKNRGSFVITFSVHLQSHFQYQLDGCKKTLRHSNIRPCRAVLRLMLGAWRSICTCGPY
jgi:hypothetical protein